MVHHNMFPPNDEPSDYAWIIDRDHLVELGHLGQSDAGTIGPRNATEQQIHDLKAGMGRKFKIYDDDKELYYTGRIIFDNMPDDADLPDEAFGPLDDFGAPNAGATEIHYRFETGWSML